MSITSNVKCTVDEVQLLLSLEFRQNAVDFVSFTPVGRPISSILQLTKTTRNRLYSVSALLQTRGTVVLYIIQHILCQGNCV